MPDDSIDFPQKLQEYLEEFVMMVGGASKGGGGWGFTYGFKPHPIPPHEPFVRASKRLTPAKRDIAIAFAIRRLASAASIAGSRELIERASSDVIEHAVRELDRTQ